jgi:thiosulfate/3-mercaptopyruvate sulfurtransferase
MTIVSALFRGKIMAKHPSTSIPVIAAFLLCIAAPAGAAAGGEGSIFVSPSWVQEQIDSGRVPLVLLHVGRKAGYDKVHLPGAQYLAREDFAHSELNGIRVELKSLEDYRALFARLGIGDNSRIVIYFTDNLLTMATRVYWTFDYLGLGDRTMILDGGLAAWQAEGLPVSSGLPSVTPGSFTPRPNRDILVDADWVRANLKNPGVMMIDSRTADFYTGENDGRGMYPRPGHLPGAVNIPYNRLVGANQKVKDTGVLRDMFRKGGVTRDRRIITYCHIGQQASLVYLIAKSLGYEVAMYDGSFTEWSKRELPVEKP